MRSACVHCLLHRRKWKCIVWLYRGLLRRGWSLQNEREALPEGLLLWRWALQMTGWELLLMLLMLWRLVQTVLLLLLLPLLVGGSQAPLLLQVSDQALPSTWGRCRLLRALSLQLLRSPLLLLSHRRYRRGLALLQLLQCNAALGLRDIFKHPLQLSLRGEGKKGMGLLQLHSSQTVPRPREVFKHAVYLSSSPQYSVRTGESRAQPPPSCLQLCNASGSGRIEVSLRRRPQRLQAALIPRHLRRCQASRPPLSRRLLCRPQQAQQLVAEPDDGCLLGLCCRPEVCASLNSNLVMKYVQWSARRFFCGDTDMD